MKTQKPKKPRMGRMARAVMIMTGRKGKRRLDTRYFSQHKERILAAWSRTNLEGRIKRWTAANILPSIWVNGQVARGDDSTWTTESNALWEESVWRL